MIGTIEIPRQNLWQSSNLPYELMPMVSQRVLCSVQLCRSSRYIDIIAESICNMLVDWPRLEAFAATWDIIPAGF